MTLGDLRDVMSRAAVKAGALRPVMDDMAQHMKASMKDNFIAQGRPVGWAYVEPHKGHRAILVDNGALVDSTSAHEENGRDVVLTAGGGGQPAAKAPSLQYGANLHGKRAGSQRGVAGQFISRSSRLRKGVTRTPGVLPPRPFALFQDEDLRYFGNEVTEFVFS